MKVTKILEPIQINKTEFKNRMVVSAMVTNYCEPNGMPTEKFMSYHEHKAKGGWGIIITEDFAISPTAGAFKRLPGLWDDTHIEPYRKFTERIHQYNGKIIPQLYHAGRETSSQITGVQCVAPSAIKDPSMNETPRELSKEEIIEIENQFAENAYRAKLAGFDGVEIHGAHGYLVNQFISPFSNKRSDEYGGTILNRTRFSIEIIKKIREKCGEDFPIIYRMSAREYVQGGLEIEEAKTVAMILQDAGIDCLHVSQGVYASGNILIPSADYSIGNFVDNASEIKKVVDIPVIAVGRINDPYLAESIVKSGKADLCTMARASLADPEMPNKIKEGRYNEIIHCIGCLQGCSGENGKGNFVRCLVNPMTGMEDEYNVIKTNNPKNIVVVGGGVAGCETAIVAAQRGHKVTILEKSDHLGGQWNAAAIPMNKSDFASLVVWQRNMLNKNGVQIKLNCLATKDLIDSYNPDTVVLATGSLPAIPDINGLKEYGVYAEDILYGKERIGKKVVVLGGGLIGAETADFVAEHGCNDVTIIERLSDIALDGEPAPVSFLKQRMSNRGVKIIISANIKEIKENAVIYVKDGEEITIENVDTSIIALGVVANKNLYTELQNVNYEVISVGDCNEKAKNGYLNIRDGFEIGLKI